MRIAKKRRFIALIGLCLCLAAAVGLYWSLKPNQSLLSLGKPKPSVLGLRVEPRVGVSQPFKVYVEADTLGNTVNAAGVYLNFDPTYLQVLNLSTSQSFCQFYPEKKFDNNLGTISLACGSPHPGFKGTNQLLVIEFMPLLVGTSTIRTSEKSQLLMSDGKGTNALEALPQETISIVSRL